MAITATMLILMLCSRTGSESQPRSYPIETETLRFGAVPAVEYETNINYDPGTIGFLFQMARTFLHVVQPNRFPREMIIEIIKQNYEDFLHKYQEIIYYEIGFVICAALGIVFILLMPVLGLCFCMCRCCDNCGGELHQRQKKNTDCRRSCFATTLFIITVIITAGTLCVFAANQNLTNKIKGIKKLVNHNFQDLHALLDYAPTQLNYISQKYGIAKEKAYSDINNIGSILGGKVNARFEKDVIPALEGSFKMARVTLERAIKAIEETKEALENLSTSRQTLDKATTKLQENLSDVRSSLNNTLNDAACRASNAVAYCDGIRDSLDSLNINASFSQLQGVDSELANVNDVLKTDFEDSIQKGHSAFNEIPAMLENETKSFSSDAKIELHEIGEKISTLTQEGAIDDFIHTSTVYLNLAQQYFLQYFPYLEKYDFYRWLASVALCCAVILILTFNYLGLLCGLCGFDEHASPTTRGCVSNTGGNLLLAGVGISFIFSWLLMLVVLATFIAGGNVEKLACQSIKDNNLFKVLDTPYLLNSQWKHFLSGLLLSEHNLNITFQSVYSKCHKNKGLYSAFQLHHLLEDHVNLSEPGTYLTDKFANIHVNLSNIVILDEEAKEGLRNFTNTGIDQINFTAYIIELKKSVTMVNLHTFANDLEAKANALPAGALANALRGHTNSVREIYKQQVITLEQTALCKFSLGWMTIAEIVQKYVDARNVLNESIGKLQNTAANLKIKVGRVIHAVESAQNLINNNSSDIVKQEIQKYSETLSSYITDYLEWGIDSMNNAVAVCKPIANAVDAADVILCGFIVDSLNGFWFGLGCCTVFLIPSIIIAVKLAKFYRRMDTEDVYDDVQNIPMKTKWKSLILLSTPSNDTLTRFPRASAPPKLPGW
ncbi:prominin-1-A-like isoform X4 [Scyliorhinus canicula]|uniref:prominin-1-A-like isoform X4 n=1 Tax=Scyliorhinus canicula TaxID=7830 RepID=UPI0018F606E1|nr:prominin-1-A-like isoform X4 [Scyliorhinus canicula]